MSERTDQEREAARLERERRRTERPGQTASESPQPYVEGLPPYEPAGEPHIFDTREPSDEHADDLAVDDHDDDLHDDDHDDDLHDADPHDDGHGAELPVGTRRISHQERKQAVETAPRSPRRPARPAKRTRSWFGRLLAVLAILLAAAVIWFLIELFQPLHGSGHGSVTVTIPPHATSRQIGDLLERDGVIASGFFFDARATLGGDRSDMRSGTYHLKLDMPYGDVLTILTTPPKAAKTSDLTITEGRTRRQIDALLHAQHVKGSYFADTHRSKLLDPHTYGAPRNVNSLEGFLFPSTYQVRDPISIGALVADQLKTFKQRFRGVNLTFAKKKNLTAYDVLIIASMVEAESATAHDRPLVSAVIYNRLRKGMPLQIDATTRYLTGNYSKPLTESELNSRSPYNTRIHKGLPPTPIDNPGMASIQAAAHPALKNYLYFVVKPCGNGEQTFTASYSQFLQDQQKYESARAAHGGRSPAHC
jgi:uncharacterized YceG family protein